MLVKLPDKPNSHLVNLLQQKPPLRSHELKLFSDSRCPLPNKLPFCAFNATEGPLVLKCLHVLAEWKGGKGREEPPLKNLMIGRAVWISNPKSES